METSELKAHLREKITESSGELLSRISMFLYNWTEGPWTPPPLSEEQIQEIKRRSEELEKGEVQTVSWEDVKAEFKEKYGVVFEKGEEYQKKKEQEDREDCIEMLEHISREHLLLLDMFLESHKQKNSGSKLSESEREAVQKSRTEIAEGRFMNAFKFLDLHG